MLRNQQCEDLTSRRNPVPNWRIRIKQTRLVSQVSTILLQRHSKFWAPLLKPLKLSSEFNPSLFHQILSKIRTHPKICLNFFNWAQKHFDFKPDLKAKCELTRILLGSQLSELGTPILSSIVQDCPPSKIVPLLVQSHKRADFQNTSPVLNSVIECYCGKQMFFQSLEVYQIAKQYGVVLSVDTCNILLNLLGDKNELRLAWCFYASTIRNGISANQSTWPVIARILYKDGKFERVSRILDMGIYNPEMFDLMIDGYSKRGDFGAAFGYLNEMCSKGIEPSFSTYSSLLDGACRYQDQQVIENVMSSMVEKGHIPEPLLVSDYDLIIRKLCDVVKTFAMDLFSKRAFDEKIELEHATYRSMLRALLSVDGRVVDAIELYNILREKNISLNQSCYYEFVTVLCKQNPSREVSNLLLDIIRGGFIAESKELSKYTSKQCAEGRWREGEELLNAILNQGCLLDSLSCGSFVKRYCSRGQIDKAIELHNKLEGLKGTLDMATYNVLLAALFKERRTEEAIKVFDYMRTCEVLNSESFTVMIRGLCHEKELRKAMKLHDEMLQLGLKPDGRTYKRLISGFR
ncbi:UNVERIFIED_CONTAM: Pentatricopeptide repeat-containing protein [Sesamum angustifolium]|uniref:Pentatricopeptide repeat-containing protein n=1 Tax=Sesamum angustifolium TaxID=2727405 RepID=A0AAW2PE32_9LAMI